MSESPMSPLVPHARFSKLDQASLLVFSAGVTRFRYSLVSLCRFCCVRASVLFHLAFLRQPVSRFSPSDTDMYDDTPAGGWPLTVFKG